MTGSQTRANGSKMGRGGREGVMKNGEAKWMGVSVELEIIEESGGRDVWTCVGIEESSRVEHDIMSGEKTEIGVKGRLVWEERDKC